MAIYWLILMMALLVSTSPTAQALDVCEKLTLTATQLEVLLDEYNFTNISTDPIYIEPFGSNIYFRTSTYRKADDLSSVYKYEPLSPVRLQLDRNEHAYSLFANSEFDLAIDFVIENYRQRRTSWSESFLEKIKDQALKDRYRSTIIIMKAALDGDILRPRIAATLKIVRAKESLNESLPIDQNLGIATPFNNGVKFELANFSILKSHSLEGFSELLIQLMIAAYQVSNETGHDKNKPSYFTYADAQSLRMYEGLGFTRLPHDYPPKIIDGTKFTPLGISTSGILNIPQTMKTHRKYWSESGLDGLVDKFELLRRASVPGQLIYRRYFPAGAFLSGS